MDIKLEQQVSVVAAGEGVGLNKTGEDTFESHTNVFVFMSSDSQTHRSFAG